MTSLAEAWMRWLKRDARNRALRTAIHTITASMVVAGLEAARAGLTGGTLDVATVWHAALSAGLTAALAAGAAYLHRVKLDPSSAPSAAPPESFERSML